MKFLKNLIFIDIETVSEKPSFSELSERMQNLWVKKSIYLKNDEEMSAEELYSERAGFTQSSAKWLSSPLAFFILIKKEI